MGKRDLNQKTYNGTEMKEKISRVKVCVCVRERERTIALDKEK